MNERIGSLSLDLDNKWAYLRTHGSDRWRSFPSYLDTVVPRILRTFSELSLRATVFVVGKDATLDQNQEALAALAEAPCEIGNHSFYHEPWLHRYGRADLRDEIALAAEAIEYATGQRPVGFRGPGFSITPDALSILAELGYLYDASSFPTFLGPLAKFYCLLTSLRLSDEQKRERERLFGSWKDGFRPLRPHLVTTDQGQLVEIPVTTLPLLKFPVHMTYLHYLSQYSRAVAKMYLRAWLVLCLATNVPPSLLLHPLDFLGAEDEPELAFFPGMRLPRQQKMEFVHYVLTRLASQFNLVTLREQALGHSTACSPECWLSECGVSHAKSARDLG
jgi:peptidoglycan/xylan/chitin deacetylase (PgdA/CDA1 family)